MKEINIARTIINKRKEKGLTQDELASYIGVSKAAVSKWEIGQSYPDITFLPQLATFFNISIDELMGYEPQMCKEDIHKLYLSLSYDFAVKPFDDELWKERRKLDKECSVEAEIQMLNRCGFSEVKCIYSYHKFSVIIAVK